MAAKWRSRALATGAALLVAAALWAVLRPNPVLVDVATAQRAPLRVTVDEEGETRVRDRYVVAAPTTGRLLRIELDEGDAVAAGSVVARIEPPPLDPRALAAARARLEAAEATQRAAHARMQRAEAALEQARRDAARAARLHATGTTSDTALEQARLAETSAIREHEEARFAATAAASEVEAARAVLIASPGSVVAPAPPDAPPPPCAGAVPCVEARAPVAGQVLRIPEKSERIVVAGTPLVEIGEPAAIEIIADVLSRDAVRVKPGTPVWIEDWGGPEALEARVRRVEPSGFTKVSALGVEEQRVNIVIDLVEPDARLGDGYRVEVRIVTWEGDDVLQIPASALFRVRDEWAVFAVEGGRARRRTVEVGAQATFEVEVREGLSEGDVVILHPSDRLDDGTRVTPR